MKAGLSLEEMAAEITRQSSLKEDYLGLGNLQVVDAPVTVA